MTNSPPQGAQPKEPGKASRNVGLRPDGTSRPLLPRPERGWGKLVTSLRPWWRLLALAVALAVAAPLTWWAVTRPTGPGGIRASAVTTTPFSPVGDAYVSSARPGVNTGSSPVLRTASRPKILSYLTFSVAGLSGTVTSATLRLWPDVADLRGAAVHAVDRSWHENSITASTAPALGETVAQTGMVAAEAWVTADITPLVKGNGQVSVAITQVGSGNGQYDSREGAHPPELVVRTNSRTLSARSSSAVLGGAIVNVPGATRQRYAARDDYGPGVDTLKIIPMPGGG